MPKNKYLSPAGAQANLAQAVFTSDRAFNKMHRGLYDYNLRKSQAVGKGGMVGGGIGLAGSRGLQWLFQSLGPYGTLIDFGLTALGSLLGKQHQEAKFGPAPEIRTSDIKFGETSLLETEMLQEEQESQYDDITQLWDSLGTGVKMLMMKNLMGMKGSNIPGEIDPITDVLGGSSELGGTAYQDWAGSTGVTQFGVNENPFGLFQGSGPAYHDWTIADITAGLIGASPWFMPSKYEGYEEEEDEREDKSEYASPSY